MGASEQQIEQFLAQRPEDAEAQTGFPVHPDNIVAVRLGLAMATQWNTTSLSTLGKARIVRTGLKYEVLEPVARMEGMSLPLSTDDFRRVRIFEVECLVAWNEAAR